MISENEFVLNMKKEFRNSKYIIIAKLERAGSADSGTMEGRINALKSYLQSEINELRKDNRQQSDTTKDDMIANIKSFDAKFLEQSSKKIYL